jgi:hypothetical protein
MLAATSDTDYERASYVMMIDEHTLYYHNALEAMGVSQVEMCHITSEREKQVFFSGCLAAANSLKFRYMLHETHR